MASADAASVAAVLRAANPSFKSDAGRVAFAVHAWMLARGYRLTAVGDAVDDPIDPAAPDSAVDGWDARDGDGAYAFSYADATPPARRPHVLVKASAVGGALAVSWLAGAGPPATAQLDVAEHVKPGTSSVVAGYADLAGLVATLDAAFPEAKEEGGGGGRGAPPPPRDGGGGVPAPAEGGSRGWGQPSPAPHTGADDLYPPGLGPGLPGLVGPGLPPEFGAPSVRGYHPGGPGGGMVVGPDDPLFGGHPGLRPPGAGPGGLPPPGLPPGARWDPVRPPGLPGFAPEDFRRGPGGPPGPHPDIMPPGPGGPGFGGGGAGMFG